MPRYYTSSKSTHANTMCLLDHQVDRLLVNGLNRSARYGYGPRQWTTRCSDLYHACIALWSATHLIEVSQAKQHRIVGQGLQCQQVNIEGQGSSECRELQGQAAFMQKPSSLLWQGTKRQDGWVIQALLESAPNQRRTFSVLQR